MHNGIKAFGDAGVTAVLDESNSYVRGVS